MASSIMKRIAPNAENDSLFHAGQTAWLALERSFIMVAGSQTARHTEMKIIEDVIQE